MHSLLPHHLKTSCPLSSYQWKFTEGKLTTTTFLSVTHECHNALDTGKEMCSTFFDFSRAFYLLDDAKPCVIPTMCNHMQHATDGSGPPWKSKKKGEFGYIQLFLFMSYHSYRYEAPEHPELKYPYKLKSKWLTSEYKPDSLYFVLWKACLKDYYTS